MHVNVVGSIVASVEKTQYKWIPQQCNDKEIQKGLTWVQNDVVHFSCTCADTYEVRWVLEK